MLDKISNLWPMLLAPVVWIFALWWHHLPGTSHNRWIAAERTCCWRWVVVLLPLPWYDASYLLPLIFWFGGGIVDDVWCFVQVLSHVIIILLHVDIAQIRRCRSQPKLRAVHKTTHSCNVMHFSQPALLLHFPYLQLLKHPNQHLWQRRWPFLVISANSASLPL